MLLKMPPSQAVLRLSSMVPHVNRAVKMVTLETKEHSLGLALVTELGLDWI